MILNLVNWFVCKITSQNRIAISRGYIVNNSHIGYMSNMDFNIYVWVSHRICAWLKI